MPINVNPIKKHKVKEALKAGIDAKNAMIKAGYSPNTAKHACVEKVVRDSQAEIIEEMRAKDITCDYLIKKTEAIITKADKKGDITNQHRGIENIARFVGIDKPQSNITNIWNISDLQETPEGLREVFKRKSAPSTNT